MVDPVSLDPRLALALLPKLDEWFTTIDKLFNEIYPGITEIPTERERLLWVISHLIEVGRTRYAGISLQRLFTHRDSLRYFSYANPYLTENFGSAKIFDLLHARGPNNLVYVFELYEEFRDRGYPELASATLGLLIDYHTLLVENKIKTPTRIRALVKSRTTPPIL